MNKKEAKIRLQMLLADRCWDCRYGDGKCERDCEFKQAINMAVESLLSDNIDVNNVTIHYKPYPSAEFEKIVYCKDCANRGDIFCCPIDEVYTVNDNDYCSYGVKKIHVDTKYYDRV